ncbi:hypothetical protein PsorP6_000022 [Peronosclerospora sorghi]|uniref:Uncharacterized protein n=1 Tax=Peronosclerospora sorghi TaxID=230839 RepID=A0ACC0WQX8_9STRA|nr:hypothetical protein PsorP6_000022 [Peronosclerospora sorghi]
MDHSQHTVIMNTVMLQDPAQMTGACRRLNPLAGFIEHTLEHLSAVTSTRYKPTAAKTYCERKLHFRE